mgnify:FL=1
MKEIKLNVQGMVCEGCERRVINVLNSLEGIENVVANHNDGTVLINLNKDVSLDLIKKTIKDIGFEVKED